MLNRIGVIIKVKREANSKNLTTGKNPRGRISEVNKGKNRVKIEKNNKNGKKTFLEVFLLEPKTLLDFVLE